ncbi:phosphoenolpyruvate--protein phosphotransferase [Hahella aquimaris]|uniref:phosphoenolpyruvate--protein phosphotransferase n=1 Tax=Hahella sp. HNIBRBA332 TaxID=3015983 RepID=UPI00273AAC4F|nr:phosphoenolpyruvate--protein phosphotransferase [Hahella sp. HNIBRBA332]WLQ14789.1 phosphoenolpyruvate--protein phosphotransferase [Hahella sp. HNIBRBA332]
MLEPLKILREIFQEAADLHAAKDLSELIVDRVQSAMRADVCSIYLLDETSQELVLMATRGLDPESVGRVRLPVGQGLVGYIAQHQSLMNVDSAEKHPNFKYFPETREERFSAFLGAPIINFRKNIGVIAVQKKEAAYFSDEQEAFVVTIAAQLAGPLSQWVQQDGVFDREVCRDKFKANLKFRGVKGAAGMAIGRVHWIGKGHDLASAPDREAKDAELEIARFAKALELAKDELNASGERMAGTLPKDVLALFGVYRMILEDQELTTETVNHIHSGLCASSALRKTVEAHARVFEKMDDAYLRAKADDIRHIGNRIYANLRGVDSADVIDVSEPTIIVGNNLSITDVAQFPPEHLVGLVCTSGSSLSHIAILANALGIPAVMGIGDIKPALIENAEAVVDGYRAVVVFNPVDALRKEFKRLAKQEKKLIKGLDELRDLPAQTPDGFRVKLFANTGLLADISPGLLRGAEGVGLYRSEIPFMVHESFPSEEEQVQIYRKVLEAYAPRPVYMRTLDIGGDKNLPYFSFTEENPFLGWRGIRFTLDNTGIFISQIRAMLKAGRYLGNLKILLPMVSRLDEIESFRSLLQEAIGQLKEAGVEVDEPQVGAMIEVPSAMVLLEDLAEMVDFFSIGSNDFTQYMLAVDRNNAKVSDLYDWLNPAVLRSIGRVVKVAKKHGVPVSVCGEMASDPAAVLLLLGMGVEMLSLSAYNLPKTKWVIRSVSHQTAEKLWKKASRMRNEKEIRAMLNEVLDQHGLGGLIRAGSQ